MKLPAASVHGRFQPFHNEHLEYVLTAKESCEFLWIGITKYDTAPSEFTPLGRPRERPENNPLTYFERISIIADCLMESGLQRGSFGFVPFPIETPRKLSEFMPTSIPVLTTVCEEWNREKIKILRSYGYDVMVIRERDKKLVSGGAIRDAILRGESEWHSLVPPATVRAVTALRLRDRLLELTSLTGDHSETRGESSRRND